MKHLKIVEQIIIVLIVAVLIPFITIGIIISNISQQSVRNELENSTKLISQFVASSINGYVSISQSQLDQIASGFNYIHDGYEKLEYFGDLEGKTKLFKNLKIIPAKDIPKKKYTAVKEDLILFSPIDEQHKYYLAGHININIFNVILNGKDTKDRNVLIVDNDSKELIVSNNPDINFEETMKGFDFNSKAKEGNFGNKKNTPKVCYRLENPNWTIIVDTTKKVTNRKIYTARSKIILSLCIAALSIIIIVSLYTYYLYINIRQLFKGITAISKGNYDKKIHLIKSAFTPHETIFIAKEFNYMANKIKISYKDLKQKNHKLQKLNEYRENLVNATSHEFRTPLTSIIGYSSRLLRHDIVVDEETRIKSLQIIKQQAQRLSDMVEDLLVVPELESYSLKFNIQEVDLIDSTTRAIEYLSVKDVEFITDYDNNLPWVWADENRLEQILVNLISNAIKYNIDNQPIKIEIKNVNNVPTLKVINKCEKISKEYKEKLFDKFIRLDSKLTRTTRGTGLGLYIVKGLCEGMNIDINLDCDDEFIMTLKFKDYVV